MAKNLTCERSILIRATPGEIWHVLTNPDTIRVFMFGSEVNTDWNPGSSVTFSRTEISARTYGRDKKIG